MVPPSDWGSIVSENSMTMLVRGETPSAASSGDTETTLGGSSDTTLGGSPPAAPCSEAPPGVEAAPPTPESPPLDEVSLPAASLPASGGTTRLPSASPHATNAAVVTARATKEARKRRGNVTENSELDR